MVHIVTGSVNSGKTTKLLSIYQELKVGDGFILPKIFIQGNYAGQQITRLSTGISRPFSFKKGYVPSNWVEKYCLDAYSFSKEGFDFAFKTIQDIIIKDLSPIFIDEIGPLELQEKGFYQLLSQLSTKDYSIYISVREALLYAAIKKFRIKEYEIIKIKPN